MSNDRLHLALSKAGLTTEQLADLLQVDPRSVQRWLKGRTPRTKHRLQIAQALGTHEQELWPETTRHVPAPERSNELEGAWPGFSEPGAPTWRQLITTATETIELCDYTLLDILETPGAPTLLQAKANAGATVRLMIASLDSLWLTLEDWPPNTRRALTTEGPLNQTIRQAHKRLWHLNTNSRAQGRQVLIPRCPAILRFDQDMLLAIPLWGESRQGAPIVHLHRREQNGLFDRLTHHFQALWETSWTINPNPDDPPPGQDDTAYASPHQAFYGQADDRRTPRLTPCGRRQPHR